MTVEGATFTLTLGKQLIIHHGKTELSSITLLRPYYTENKEAFEGMLESLRSQADQVVSIGSDIVTALVASEIPKAVLKRMSGEEEDTTLAGTMVEKKLRELVKESQKFPTLATGKFALMPVATRSLSFEHGDKKTCSIEWGSIKIDLLHHPFGHDQDVELGESEDQVFFLANFNLIKSRLVAFWTDLTVLTKKHLEIA
jgi:hypothetical protein